MIPARPVIRVATWNIRAAIGPGEPFPPGWWRHVDRSRLARIGAHLATLDADVVALQEVAVMTVDGDLLAQPAALAESTGLVAHYGAVHHTSFVEPADGGTVGAGLWGNALLTRHEPDDRRTVGLPAGEDDATVDPAGSGHPWSGRTFADCEPGVREARCVVAATIHYAGGPLQVLSTHLSYAGGEQRRAQAAAIVELVAASSGPAVVLGDLNAPIEAPELEPLRAALVDAFAVLGVAPGDHRRTSCGPSRIDHVFVRGLEVVDVHVDRSAGDLSDHQPVIATLRPA